MKKHYLPLLALALSFLFATLAQANFPDVPSDHPNFWAIANLVDYGVVQGFPDGEFKPDELVDRSQFLKMAYTAEVSHENDRRSWGGYDIFPFDKKEEIKITPPCFGDLQGTEWFEPFVCWGKNQGLVSGDANDGLFHPLRPVNFAEAAKILVETSHEPGVRTGDQVEHWAEGYIESISMGMVPPSIQTADQQLTRAQAAQLIYNYTLAPNEILKDTPSNALVWDGQQYLTFECLGAYDQIHFLRREGEIYWRNSQNLKVTYALEGADAASFEVLENGLSKDKNGYYNLTEPIEFEGDVDNIEFVAPNLAREEDKVHYFMPEGEVKTLDYIGSIPHYNDFIMDAPATLTSSEYYLKDETSVYYLNTDQINPPLEMVEGADPDSFELAPMNEGGRNFIALDDNALYWEGEEIQGSAGGNFEVLGENFTINGQLSYYAKDEQYLYIIRCSLSCFSIEKLNDSDAQTFEILEEGYAKDKNQTYYLGEILEGEEGQNFEILSNGYAFGEYVYFQGKIILTADPDTFELSPANNEELYCTMRFARDEEYVFLQDKQLYNVDADSFEFLDPYGFFFKDAENVYRVILEAKGDPCRSPEWTALSGIDGDSFEFLSPYYFKNNGQIYHTTATGITNVVSEADYDSFKSLVTDLVDDSSVRYSYYAKDAENAYYNTQIIAEIDVETFEYDPELKKLKDKNGAYGWTEISKKLGLN